MTLTFSLSIMYLYIILFSVNLDFPRGFMPCFSYVEKVSRNCQASHSVVVVDHSPSSAIFFPWFILSSVIFYVKKRFHWNCTLLIDDTVWPSQKTQHKFFKMYIWCCAFFLCRAISSPENFVSFIGMDQDPSGYFQNGTYQFSSPFIFVHLAA